MAPVPPPSNVAVPVLVVVPSNAVAVPVPVASPSNAIAAAAFVGTAFLVVD